MVKVDNKKIQSDFSSMGKMEERLPQEVANNKDDFINAQKRKELEKAKKKLEKNMKSRQKTKKFIIKVQANIHDEKIQENDEDKQQDDELKAIMTVKGSIFIPQQQIESKSLQEDIGLLALSLSNSDIQIWNIHVFEKISINRRIQDPQKGIELSGQLKNPIVSFNQEMLYFAEKFGKRIAVYDTILKKEYERHEYPFKQIKQLEYMYADGSNKDAGILFQNKYGELFDYSMKRRMIIDAKYIYIEGQDGNMMTVRSSYSQLSISMSMQSSRQTNRKKKKRKRRRKKGQNYVKKEKKTKSKVIISFLPSGQRKLYCLYDKNFRIISSSSPGEIIYTETEAPAISHLHFYEPRYSHELIRDTFSFNNFLEISNDQQHYFYILTQFGEILAYDYNDDCLLPEEGYSFSVKSLVQKWNSHKANDEAIQETFDNPKSISFFQIDLNFLMILISYKEYLYIMHFSPEIKSSQYDESESVVTSPMKFIKIKKKWIKLNRAIVIPRKFDLFSGYGKRQFFVIAAEEYSNIFLIEFDLNSKQKEVFGKNIGKDKILLLTFDQDTQNVMVGKSDGDVDIFKFDSKSGLRMDRRISFNAIEFTIMSYVPKLGNLDADKLFGGQQNGIIMLLYCNVRLAKVVFSKMFTYHTNAVIQIRPRHRNQDVKHAKECEHFISLSESNEIAFWDINFDIPLKVYHLNQHTINVFLYKNKEDYQIVAQFKESILKLDLNLGIVFNKLQKDSLALWTRQKYYNSKFGQWMNSGIVEKMIQTNKKKQTSLQLNLMIQKFISQIKEEKLKIRARLSKADKNQIQNPLFMKRLYAVDNQTNVRSLVVEFYRFFQPQKKFLEVVTKGKIWINNLLIMDEYQKKIMKSLNSAQRQSLQQYNKIFYPELLHNTRKHKNQPIPQETHEHKTKFIVKDFKRIKTVLKQKQIKKVSLDYHKQAALYLKFFYEGKDDIKQKYDFLEKFHFMNRDRFNDEDLNYCIRLVKNQEPGYFGKDQLKKQFCQSIEDLDKRYMGPKKRKLLDMKEEKSRKMKKFMKEQKQEQFLIFANQMMKKKNWNSFEIKYPYQKVKNYVQRTDLLMRETISTHQLLLKKQVKQRRPKINKQSLSFQREIPELAHYLKVIKPPKLYEKHGYLKRDSFCIKKRIPKKRRTLQEEISVQQKSMGTFIRKDVNFVHLHSKGFTEERNQDLYSHVFRYIQKTTEYMDLEWYNKPYVVPKVQQKSKGKASVEGQKQKISFIPLDQREHLINKTIKSMRTLQVIVDSCINSPQYLEMKGLMNPLTKIKKFIKQIKFLRNITDVLEDKKTMMEFMKGYKEKSEYKRKKQISMDFDYFKQVIEEENTQIEQFISKLETSDGQVPYHPEDEKCFLTLERRIEFLNSIKRDTDSKRKQSDHKKKYSNLYGTTVRKRKMIGKKLFPKLFPSIKRQNDEEIVQLQDTLIEVSQNVDRISQTAPKTEDTTIQRGMNKTLTKFDAYKKSAKLRKRSPISHNPNLNNRHVLQKSLNQNESEIDDLISQQKKKTRTFSQSKKQREKAIKHEKLYQQSMDNEEIEINNKILQERKKGPREILNLESRKKSKIRKTTWSRQEGIKMIIIEYQEPKSKGRENPINRQLSRQISLNYKAMQDKISLIREQRRLKAVGITKVFQKVVSKAMQNEVSQLDELDSKIQEKKDQHNEILKKIKEEE